MPNNKSKVTKKFDRWASKMSDIVGSPYWFFFSFILVLVWFPSGFFLGFNEIWHLLINTTTTIFTFLMMALLHASQRKWENRMENIQKREGSTLKGLKEDTAHIKKSIPPKTKT